MHDATLLPLGVLDTLFPFHFVLDSELNIVGFGPSLPLIIPHIAIQHPLSRFMQIQRPHQQLNKESIANSPHTLFVFMCCHSELQLRGQFLCNTQNRFIFVGSPWLSSVSQLQQYALSLNDFAVHDNTADLLQIMQIEKNALEETRNLAVRLKKKRVMLQSVLNTAADAIITISQHGLIESFNPAAELMFGWSTVEIIGQNISLLIPELHTPNYDDYLSHYIQKSQSNPQEQGLIGRRHELNAKYRDASEFPIELSLSAPLYGDEFHFTAIIRDISLRQAQQAALISARERELKMGHDIQQTLLFGTPLKVPGVEISAFTQPSQGIDGDFFDFFPIEPNCFDVLTGDVMGKGVAAAMLGAGLKNQYIRIMAELLGPALQLGQRPAIEMIINQLNSRLTPELQRLESFVTLAFARIDLDANLFNYISAGHPEGLLLHTDGSITMLSGKNLPIGIESKEHYESATYPFLAGDLLLLYSDGLTEARNKKQEFMGIQPILDLVSQLYAAQIPPAIILQRLRQIVEQYEGTLQRSDDFTAISLYRHTTTALHYQEFPRKMQILSQLRQWIRERTDLSPVLHDQLTLAAVEVATNIIRHVAAPLADTPFVVHLLSTATVVTLSFYYVGDAFDSTQSLPPDFSGHKEGGFGLYIIQNCVDHVEYLIPAEQVNLTRLRLNKDCS
ncbi:SpoIIE family protein phosphatase [uncultured Deefgea sp.]|uniref:SpoIIE family protein phosphatase n=1 Tax=uncultured Deefgea sp. TaxID=1304914 RepID=UPI002601EB81|nr:SpoIIE family protein phosphatase [uncultured Deefgea sp.]